MNLKLILPTKKIQLGDKEIHIPKLGLKHHNLIKNEPNPYAALRKIMQSIFPNLTAAESDFVSLHLLEFNGKLKDKREINGFTYKLDDVYICQRLEFSYQGKTFKFRSNKPYEEFGPVDNLLETLYLGEDVPDFLDMPAFVAKWADDITSTLAIPGPNGPVKGLLKIMELLNE